MPAILSIRDLCVTFNTPSGTVNAVRRVSLDVEQGEILGVVGESGCGKSVTFRALLGLAPSSATVTGDVTFDGSTIDTDGALCDASAMIYQNPGAALNPVFTIGQQLALVAGTSDEKKLASLLDRVGLPDPLESLKAYPHQFSGGMRQRAVIAYALAQKPKLLIADEPTTALDVTTQAQVLDLIKELRDEEDLTVIFISHDLAVIERLCDRIAVLYAGRVIEIGTTEQVLNSPEHPYTTALLNSIPRPENLGTELASIPGLVPDGRSEIVGCGFAPRCTHASDVCRSERPALRQAADGHSASCVLVKETS